MLFVSDRDRTIPHKKFNLISFIALYRIPKTITNNNSHKFEKEIKIAASLAACHLAMRKSVDIEKAQEMT